MAYTSPLLGPVLLGTRKGNGLPRGAAAPSPSGFGRLSTSRTGSALPSQKGMPGVGQHLGLLTSALEEEPRHLMSISWI